MPMYISLIKANKVCGDVDVARSARFKEVIIYENKPAAQQPITFPIDGSVATMDYSNLSTDEATILSEADRLAAMYDYDGAIARVQAFAGYESNQNMLDAIDRYTQTKSTCIAYNVEEIPHFFYHSLLNDDRGFKAELVGDFVAKDNDCWMCSTEEFNVITQQMYDYGIVLISLHDLGQIRFKRLLQFIKSPDIAGLIACTVLPTVSIKVNDDMIIRASLRSLCWMRAAK